MSQDKSKNIDRIIQVVLAIIGAAATIYAGFQANTIINITESQTAIVQTATQERLEVIQAPSQPPFYITQLVEATRLVEITSTQPPYTATPEITITPSPTPFVIDVGFEDQTTRKTFWYILSTVEVTRNNLMRLNMSFWSKSDDYGYLRLDLKGCAYVSDRDSGNRFAFVDSNYTNGEKIVVQPNTKVDYWFDFENAIDKGAKNLTIGLCPNFYAGDFFETFNISLNY